MSRLDPMSAPSDPKREHWNRRYASADRHATPVPNRFLVAELSDMVPGRALDLACGAGRNAVWLAEQGWRVTAVDFSDVGLTMARDLALARGVEIDWIEADVVAWVPESRAYDLVCALYLQLPAPERRSVLRHAADAVAPGGTLLVVGHDLSNLIEGWGGPSQTEVLYTPDDIVAEIDGLQVEKAERVRRPVEDGGVLHDAIDALVRARRPSAAGHSLTPTPGAARRPTAQTTDFSGDCPAVRSRLVLRSLPPRESGTAENPMTRGECR